LKRIRWSLTAADDLQGVYDYLLEHRPSMAAKTVRTLYDAARSLKRFPERGRLGLVAGTRELVVAPMPYIIVYDIRNDVVQILRVIHGANRA